MADLTTDLSKFLTTRPWCPMHQATVTLTNAQIIALPTANVQLVVSDVTGTHALLPVAAVVTSYFSAGTYTNDAGGLLYLGYDSSTPTVGLNPVIWSDLDQSGTPDGYWSFMGIRTIATDSPFTVPGSMVESGVQYLDVVLRLKTNAGTALTGGNAANTLKVSVAYLTLNTTTGVFV